MITMAAALDVVAAATHRLSSEKVPLTDALERVARESVRAPIDLPLFDNAAMDGYAVRADDVTDHPARLLVVAEIAAGTTPPIVVGTGQAAKIMTGAPLPQGADSVVPVELTRPVSQRVRVGDVIIVRDAIAAGANVRRRGEDMATGSAVIDPGRLTGPADLGVLAALGITSIRVTRHPDVAVLATGSELVAADGSPGPGQIPDVNSITCSAQVTMAGGRPRSLGIAPDDFSATRRLFEQALEANVVISSGGVSVGQFDFLKSILRELGVQRRFWGVKMKPGWPLLFGTKGDTLVFCVPGNPVAAMVSFELFIRPALLGLQGRADVYRPYVVAAAAGGAKPTKGRAQVMRCRLKAVDGGWSFERIGNQGSGALRSMALADGLALIPPRHTGGVDAEFPVMLLSGTSVERPPLPG